MVEENFGFQLSDMLQNEEFEQDHEENFEFQLSETLQNEGFLKVNILTWLPKKS